MAGGNSTASALSAGHIFTVTSHLSSISEISDVTEPDFSLSTSLKVFTDVKNAITNINCKLKILKSVRGFT